jgi:hypothetical protein
VAVLPFLGFNGLLAQLAEQLTLNQRVVGSSPTRPTRKKSISINNGLCCLIGVGFSFILNLSPILFQSKTLNQLDSVLQNHLDMIIESLSFVGGHRVG